MGLKLCLRARVEMPGRGGLIEDLFLRPILIRTKCSNQADSRRVACDTLYDLRLSPLSGGCRSTSYIGTALYVEAATAGPRADQESLYYYMIIFLLLLLLVLYYLDNSLSQ